MIPSSQAEIVELLRRSSRGEIETALSVLFLGPDEVFKLRKAVRLDFVDFTDPAVRRRAARREVELNAPAAPGLYRGVAAVTRAGLAPEEAGDALDWGVRLARVPEGDFIEARLSGGLEPALLDGLGDAVAEWHARAERVSDDPVTQMAALVESNAVSAGAAGLEAARVEAWRAAARAAFARRGGWMARRGREGFLRRCHGDLHLGNFCFWRGRPVPFDALEFDEAMARIDPGYDLAFLLMDLDLRVGRAAANRVLNRYVARTGDAGLAGGLAPFLSLRAMVRAHGLMRAGMAGQAGRHLAAAEVYLRPAAPIVVAVGGLPGAGKSTLARALAPDLGAAPGALVLRSDEIRKRRFGVPPEQRLPESAYAEEVSRAVMAELCRLAGEAAGLGQAVIADATFLDPADRAAIAAAATGAAGGEVPFLGLWLSAPREVLEGRVAARRGDASDATVEVLRRAAAADRGGGGWREVPAGEAGAALATARGLLAGKLC